MVSRHRDTNWFLYEYALALYDHFTGSGLKPIKKWRAGMSDKQLAEFCAYYAKRMRVSILENIEGNSGIIALYDIYLTDYFHENTLGEDDVIGKACNAAWRGFLQTCAACPCKCLDVRDDRCGFFDRMERGGYLS